MKLATEWRHRVACVLAVLVPIASVAGCSRTASPASTASDADEPSPRYRNIETATDYVGDAACVSCHADAAAAYQPHGMARSFHRWTPDTRIEALPDEPLFHAPSGFSYSVVEIEDDLYQEESLSGPDGRRIHELRRRMDYVMGSGNVARTYFTVENGRLFQLPLTWYNGGGWDFSPGYEVNNARFGRLMPDRCLACHGSYPDTIPYLEGKYAALPPGIGCERCHGPGALHVAERSAGIEPDSVYDRTIVNPIDLPFERRLDVCQQCHVHTPVTVLREGRNAFSYLPSEPLSNHAAFFKIAGSIDIVSHADRLRQSSCFVATRSAEHPMECATCHNPHEAPSTGAQRNQPCHGCHAASDLAQRLASSAALADHEPTAHCVECHMPRVQERTVPHGSFTDHWIRVFSDPAQTTPRERRSRRPIEPYFERDRTGSDARVYQAMGEIVYATRADDAQVLRDAAETLRRALGSDASRGEGQFLLGLAYRQLGEVEDAVAALERSVQHDSLPQRLHALALAYQRVGRDANTIERLYRLALQLQPALAFIRADYADFLHARGRRDEAEQAYRGALAEQPGLDVAQFNLAALLAATGRFTEASEEFQAAVLLNPSFAEALTSLFHVRVAGDVVTGVRALGSPLTTLPVRSRGRNAVRVVVERNGVGVSFVNVPAGGTLRIVRPNGLPVRDLLHREGLTLDWDLLTAFGTPVAGGLYRAQMIEDAAAAASDASQGFYFAIVR